MNGWMDGEQQQLRNILEFIQALDMVKEFIPYALQKCCVKVCLCAQS